MGFLDFCFWPCFCKYSCNKCWYSIFVGFTGTWSLTYLINTRLVYHLAISGCLSSIMPVYDGMPTWISCATTFFGLFSNGSRTKTPTFYGPCPSGFWVSPTHKRTPTLPLPLTHDYPNYHLKYQTHKMVLFFLYGFTFFFTYLCTVLHNDCLCIFLHFKVFLFGTIRLWQRTTVVGTKKETEET